MKREFCFLFRYGIVLCKFASAYFLSCFWLWRKIRPFFSAGCLKFKNEFIQPIRSIRVSYLPPLMVYFAAGVSGLTGIVQTFFITKHLGLQPNFLAILGFWAGMWWAFKMPIGHLVDLFWRFKSWFIFLGAALMAASFGIMIGLIGYTDAMLKYMSAESWYIIAVLMTPFTYMLQDVVADAMTSEAISRFNPDGTPRSAEEMKPEHITMQMLGRAAILFGGFIVAGASGWFARMPSPQIGLIMTRIVLVVLGLMVALKIMKLALRLVKKLTVKIGGITGTIWSGFISAFLSAIAFLPLFILGLAVADFFAAKFAGGWLKNIHPYETIYWLAMLIPVSSVMGVVLAFVFRFRQKRNLLARGFSCEDVEAMLSIKGGEKTKINWWILGGSAVFLIFAVPFGLLSLTFKRGLTMIPFFNLEIVKLPLGIGAWLPAHADTALFICSFAVICFMIAKVAKELSPESRAMLIGTAVIVFVFRTTPSIGQGLNFYYIEKLRFDERFMGTLSQIGSFIAFFGLFFLRPMMAKRSLAWTYGFLTILGTFFLLPVIGLVFGMHHWLAGILNSNSYRAARMIALIDTVAESPFGQLAMVPLLAWIAQDAPPKYKATYFALMASFTNLALSAGALGTRYLNEWFIIVKPEYDRAGEILIKPGDYAQLGNLTCIVGAISFVFPLMAIVLFTPFGGKEAIVFRVWHRLFKQDDKQN